MPRNRSRDRYRVMYLGFGDGRTAFKSIFPSPEAPPPPPAPVVTPPPPMPDPNAPNFLAARKTAMSMAGQGGRSSTVLTKAGAGMASTLAGSYAATKLGSS